MKRKAKRKWFPRLRKACFEFAPLVVVAILALAAFYFAAKAGDAEAIKVMTFLGVMVP